MSGSGDWLQFYHQNLSNTAEPPSDNIASTEAAVGSLAGNTGVSTGLNPEGRVGKPIRRRSRASRRTPTTLLNTDTTNFRAMVQQFTGGPTPPFAASISNSGVSNFTLGFGGIRQSHIGSPPASVMSPPSAYHHHHHLHPQQQQQQFYHHHQNPPPYMYQTTAHGDSGFLQRLSATRPTNTGVSADGFLIESSVSSQISSARVSADISDERNGGNGSFPF